MNGRRRLAGLVLASALLGACATRPQADAGDPWTSGRLSLQVDASAERPAHGVSASFDLRGNGDRGELRLTSPLGSLIAVARWDAGEASLDTGQGPVRYPDLDSLSRQALGEALPLAALPDWLAGRPWRGAASRAGEGGFEQLGWAIRTADLAEGRLQAERPAAPKVVVRVRLDAAG